MTGMTPAARTSAAIQILDAILNGQRAEAALFEWGRSSRFAGSGDRHAIRDLVYQALRRRRSAAWIGGSDTGRGLVLGVLRLEGPAPDTLFTGERFAPEPVAAHEAGKPLADAPEPVRLDCPDWLYPEIKAALGAETEAALAAGQQRAPVFLRVNSRRASRFEAEAALGSEEIETRAHPQVASALEAVSNARKIQQSVSYTNGVVELQDAHSQAVTLALGDVSGLRVLDYCAGGGGKSLHLADLGAEVTAHDIDPKRMRDLPARAERAGLRVATALTAELANKPLWPVVLVDAPCSGSGTWRRDPEGKWALSAQRLADLTALQAEILDQTASYVAPGGRLAFATCSVLDAEGPDQAASFLARHPEFSAGPTQRFLPGPEGDGFWISIFTKK